MLKFGASVSLYLNYEITDTMFDNLKADLGRKLEAYTLGIPEGQVFIHKIKLLLEFSTIATIVYRYGSWAASLKVPVVRHILFLIYWVLNVLTMWLTGIWVHHSSKIGKGLVLHNFSGIFIIPQEMGENCTINQGVNLGGIRGSKRPVVGNNVYFGAGCKVLGDFRIGNNVVIGANSVVFTDVPDDATVLGIPGKIMARNLGSAYRELGAKQTSS